jgi:deoxyribodipyrimidine photolyase-related protein
MHRHLVLVLGDQLDPKSAAFDGFDRTRDSVWMAEVAEESTHVWTHKARIAVFLSAMRHFRLALTAAGIDVDYTELSSDTQSATSARTPDTLADALLQGLDRARAAGRSPDAMIVVEPGEWRVRAALEAAATQAGIPLEIRPDRHFFSSREEFAAHARG